MHTKFWPENVKERDHFEDLGVDVKIILEWILGKYGWEGVVWIQWSVAGCCEHGNETSGSIKGGEFLG
jgi:hypothetical protein